jgi:hypothetical protein
MFEIHYYDKDGIRVFDECRTRKQAEARLAKLKASGKVDEGKDVAICQYDAEGDLV